MDADKKPKSSCSCFPFSLFNSRRPPRQDRIVNTDVGSGRVWTQSTGAPVVKNEDKVGSPVSHDDQRNHVNWSAENYIASFYKNQDSYVEVERVLK